MSNESIKPINVAEELSQSFLEYSMSVIISRALPDVRDGLKTPQRLRHISVDHASVLDS